MALSNKLVYTPIGKEKEDKIEMFLYKLKLKFA